MTKKLTAKSIRQGQTVYELHSVGNVWLEYVVERRYIINTLRSPHSRYAFYSRRKAVRKAKELNHMMR